MHRQDLTDADRRETAGLDRREFMRRLLMAGLGAPVALGALGAITGCDTVTGEPGGGGDETLQQVVTRGVNELQAVRDDIRNATEESDAIRQGWLNRINTAVRDTWDAVAAASDAQRRAAVHPDMQRYLQRLDEWEVPLRTPQQIPQWSLNDLGAAATRTASILQAHPEANARVMLGFVLFGCLLRPLWPDGQIWATAVPAQQGDTDDASGQLYDMIHGAWQATQQAPARSGQSAAMPARGSGGEEPAVRPAHFWDFEDYLLDLALDYLEAIGLLWFWEILCNISEDLAMYFAMALGWSLFMCFGPDELDDMFSQLETHS